MAFLQPWMLWGAMAVAVPIAIHLIHRRRMRRMAFPAVEFILRSRKAVAQKFRLKQLLLLLCRCLLIGAVAVAAARPLFPGRDAAVGPSGGPAAVAIAVDTSLSMRQRLGNGKTALEAAKDAASALARSLGPDVEGVVVPFGADARPVPAVPTADKGALLAAIGNLSPGWSGTNIAKALDIAAAAIAGSTKPVKLVYLFTDAAGPAAWKEVSPRDPQQKIGYRLIDVTDGPVSNSAVTALEVHEEGGGALARVEVTSFADKPASGVGVELSVNDKPAGRNFLDLPAGSSASTRFSIVSPPGNNVALARLAADALPEDDVRWAVFRGRMRVRTLLVDGDPKTTIRDAETFYLERALAPSREATATVAPVVVDQEGLLKASLAQYDVIVLANVGSLPGATVQALRRWVAAGGGLFFTLGDKVEAESANASFGDLLPMRLRGIRETRSAHSEGGAAAQRELSLQPPAGKHPITASLEASNDVFGSTRFHKVELLEAGSSGAGVILRFSDGSPALVEKSYEKGRTLLLATTADREWTDLPIATIYLPLMRRTVRYLAGELGEAASAEALVGRPTRIEVGSEHPRVKIEGPTGFPVLTLAPVDGAIEVTPTLPGVYRLSREDAVPDERLAAKAFAANVDTAESDLRKVAPEDLARIFAGIDFQTSGGARTVASGPKGKATPDKPVWGLLLGLGLLAVVAESAVEAL